MKKLKLPRKRKKAFIKTHGRIAYCVGYRPYVGPTFAKELLSMDDNSSKVDDTKAQILAELMARGVWKM